MRNTAYIIAVVIITILAAIIFLDLRVSEPLTLPPPPSAEIDNEREQEADAKAADLLLRQGQHEEALEIITSYIPDIQAGTPNGERFAHLLMIVSEEGKDIPQLRTLYTFNPDLFEGYEKASLLVGESFVAEGELENYRRLRERWSGRETLLQGWILLDSDKLLLEGRRGQANNLLSSTTFNGKAEIDRLTRLALLNANDNPKAAWRYLSTAQSKEADNPEIRFYKGKLLESVGKNNFASREYEAAATMDPSNLFLQDQLAEFYLRQGRHQKAMDIWAKNLQSPTLDMIWVKTIFWSRVLIPTNIDWSSFNPPAGKLSGLVKYLLEMPKSKYWDKASFSKLALRDYYLDTEQATYWLRLIDALKQGHEQEAMTILQNNSFVTTSWNPELDYTLKQILNYRKKGRLDQRLSPIGLQMGHKEGAPLFTQIETYALNPDVEIPDSLHELFLSKEVFSAAFISAGWSEAGLDLHQLHILPRHFPDWVAVELTKALRKNRTDLDALDFASVQPQSPSLKLEVGEMYITGGDSQSALRTLEPLATEYSKTGSRAALLASLIYLERGEVDTATDIIHKQPHLAHDVKGKEVLAKASIMKGDAEKTREIYESIQDKSIEAKTYLAERAFKEQRFDSAKTLTEDLLKLYPNNKQLQNNLERIIQEQQKKTLLR